MTRNDHTRAAILCGMIIVYLVDLQFVGAGFVLVGGAVLIGAMHVIDRRSGGARVDGGVEVPD